MPTPFYHLSTAEELSRHPQLSGSLAQLVRENMCPFLLGNTAPDVQVISAQPRQDTHFFSLPIQNGMAPAWEQFFVENPKLSNPRLLYSHQAVFLAGYICHLQADWLWIKRIYAPTFSQNCSWETSAYRNYIHNVLRSYLDLQVWEKNTSLYSYCLETVDPSGWLPFVEDRYLCEWRDLLSRQLKPGGSKETVEVFAARQGMDPADFYRLLESEERMDREVFCHLNRNQLDAFRHELIGENLFLLESYFSGKYTC